MGFRGLGFRGFRILLLRGYAFDPQPTRLLPNVVPGGQGVEGVEVCSALGLGSVTERLGLWHICEGFLLHLRIMMRTSVSSGF